MSPKSSLLSPKPGFPPAGSEKIERRLEAQKIRESVSTQGVVDALGGIGYTTRR